MRCTKCHCHADVVYGTIDPLCEDCITDLFEREIKMDEQDCETADEVVAYCEECGVGIGLWDSLYNDGSPDAPWICKDCACKWYGKPQRD